MQAEKIFEKISQLNGSAQKKVADYVNLLYRSVQNKPAKKIRKRSISKEKIIGMWADRKDMKDSKKWLRSARASHWKSG